jgi:hypothetical protein
MADGNQQRTSANTVIRPANNQQPIFGIVGNAAFSLTVLRIPKKDDSEDFIPDSFGQALDRVHRHCSPLTGFLVSSVALPFVAHSTYLYPPATILVFGHLELAVVNIFVISAMAPEVVPEELTLSCCSVSESLVENNGVEALPPTQLSTLHRRPDKQPLLCIWISGRCKQLDPYFHPYCQFLLMLWQI